MAFLWGGEFRFVEKPAWTMTVLQEPTAAFHPRLGQGQVPISSAVTVQACLAISLVSACQEIY